MGLQLTMAPDEGSTGSNRSRPARLFALLGSLLGRLYVFAAIVALEMVLIAGVLHIDTVFHSDLVALAIVSFAVFLCLGHSRLKIQRESVPFRFVFLAAHIVCIAAAAYLRVLTLIDWAGIQSSQLAYAFIIGLLIVGTPLLALACLPLRTWIIAIRTTGTLWRFSALAGLLAVVVRAVMWFFWHNPQLAPGRFLQVATFHSVNFALNLFLPDVAMDVATFTIGTPRFSVTILPPCSGVEGLGLVLVFTSVWLWYLRKESRFPQALLLIPCALGCAWLLNIARLTALIIIGDKVGQDVAMVGFHSQAGWIAFTLVALGFSVATQKLSWVRRDPSPQPSNLVELTEAPIESPGSVFEKTHESPCESPAIHAYLVPFLTILAVSIVSKAASGNFEWLYPLRFIAALIAIWHFRPELKKLNWRFGWIAPVAGVAVFFAWIVPSFWGHEESSGSLGFSLQALTPSARLAWIAFRIAAAAITVPIAEELAFRGFLARRLVGREFDCVSFSRLTILPIAVSSVAFGLMHGQQWLVGILAGLVFALVLRWRGRIGDAVVAHAVSNLLLAAWVLCRGDWAQW